MGFQASRLRRGELLAGAGGIALLLCLLLVPWYGLSGAAARGAQSAGLAATANGWHTLTTLRWLILITVLAAFALVYFQASRRGPALPASLSVIVTVLGTFTSLGLIWRVLISVPGAGAVSARAGAYLGLLCALALAAGGLWSLREEDPPDPERNAAIPVVDLP